MPCQFGGFGLHSNLNFKLGIICFIDGDLGFEFRGLWTWGGAFFYKLKLLIAIKICHGVKMSIL